MNAIYYKVKEDEQIVVKTAYDCTWCKYERRKRSY